jgi:hypothetical protein
VAADQAGRNAAETLLIHVGLHGDEGHQAANQLEIAVDIAFELGAHEAELFADIGAHALIVNDTVLVFGKQARDHRHGKRDPDSDEARPEKRPAGFQSGQGKSWHGFLASSN